MSEGEQVSDIEHTEVTKTTDEGTTTEVSDAIKEPDGTIHEQSQTTREPDHEDKEAR